MSTILPASFRRRIFVLVAALIACVDTTAPDGATDSEDTGIRFLVMDAASAGGKPGFYFLPPIVSKASFSGTLDATLLSKLEIRVCALPACSTSLAVFSRTTSPAVTLISGKGYQLNWQTKANSLSPNTNYRLGVYANTDSSGAVLLGVADIDVVENSKALKSVPAGMIGLVKDALLNVKFRVETGVIASIDITPDTATLLLDESRQFSAVVRDLHDASVTTLPITWTSSSPATASISSSSGASTIATAAAAGTAYVRAAAADVADSALVTVSSEAAPFVQSTSPANNATGVSTSGNLTVTFDEPVNLSGDWFTLSCGVSGSRNVAATTVTGGPTAYTIDPAADFEDGETCTLTVVAAQVSDADPDDPPDVMVSNHTVTFTTADDAPSVSSTTPADGATDVASDAGLTVAFSEAVNATSSSFALTCASSAVAYSLSASPSTSFTLTPNAPLPAGASCSLTVVATSVTDVDAVDPPDNPIENHVTNFTVAVPTAAPIAQDDALSTLAGTELTADVNANNGSGSDEAGYPVAAVASFGGGSAGESVESNVAGASIAFAGGTLSINAAGELTLSSDALPGTYTVLYRLTNSTSSDDATVTITVRLAPDAINDSTAMLTEATLDADVLVSNGGGADVAGHPAATVASFGGGSLAGDATATAAGSSVQLAGGTLTLNANGSLNLTAPDTPGVYTFSYRITNSVGSDDAVVTIVVRKPPVVQFTTPADEATGVAADASITVTFSAPVSLTGEWFSLSCPVSGDRNVAATTVSTGTTTFTIDPTADFAAGETCTLTVLAAGVTANETGAPANPMLADQEATFTILDIAPSVVSSTPADDAVDVASNATISVTFSEPVNATAASFTLSCAETAVPYTLSASPAVTFTLTPDSPLPATAACTVTVVAAEISDADAVDPPQNPVADHTFDFTTATPPATPDAIDDALFVLFGSALTGSVTSDNGSGADQTGYPAATVASFGGGSAGGAVDTNAAGDTISFAGGKLTIAADGALHLSGEAAAGTYTVLYRLTNSTGSDDATVGITVRLAPDAKNDSIGAVAEVTLNGDVTADNAGGADILGHPQATVVSFGGGSLSGDATTHAPDTSVSLAGGTLTVNADGTFSLVSPTTAGTYMFDYRITNDAGSDDATVTIVVRSAPNNNRVWTGAVSSAWELAGNWENELAPDTASLVSVPTVANAPLLAADDRITSLTGAGLFDLGGFRLTVLGNVSVAGSATNGTIRMTSALQDGELGGNIPGLIINRGARLSAATLARGAVLITDGSLVASGVPLTISIP